MTLKAALAASLLSASPATAEVVLINVFEVPSAQAEATVQAWQAARDFLAKEPGYLETRLYRAQSPDARFQLVNVARWQSAEAFGSAIARMQQAGVFTAPPGLTATPALYQPLSAD